MPRSTGQERKLLALREYFHQYTDKDHTKSIKEIIDYLESKDIFACEKTIYKDISILRDILHEPVEYNPHKHGYALKKPTFEPYELRLMIDSIQSNRFITQAEASSISAKIKNMANVYVKDSLNRVSYVSGRIHSMNDAVVKDTDKIYHAIQGNYKISFRYFHHSPDNSKSRTYSKKGDNYVVSPFATHWENGNYYLYAYVSDKKSFRSFRIDRMERISELITTPRDGIEEYHKYQLTAPKVKVFQTYHGKEYKVKMRFSNHLASSVIDQFGEDIWIAPEDKGHFTIVANVEISPPFFAWIATFGRSAKILSPEPVVEEMKKFIGKINDMYNEEGEK